MIGSNLRHEMPLLAHRIRKAAIKGGAKVAFLNPRVFEYLFPVAAYGLSNTDLLSDLARARACGRGQRRISRYPPAWRPRPSMTNIERWRPR